MEEKYISRFNQFIYICSTILQKAFTLLLPICIQQLIDAVTDARYDRVLDKGAQCILVTVILILCMSISNYSAVAYEEGMTIHLRKQILDSLNRMNYSDFSANGSGYYFQRFQSDVSGCRSFFIRKKVNIWLNAVYAAAIVILMFQINIRYALCMLLPFPILGFLYTRLAAKVEAYTDESETTQDGINSHFNETIHCGYTLRLRNAGEWHLRRADGVFDERFRLQNKLNGIETFYDMFLITGILNLLTTSVYLLGGIFAFHDIISIGMITAMALYFSKLWSPLEFFLDYPEEYAEYKIHKKRIDEILAVPTAQAGQVLTEPLQVISLRHVGISYQQSEILRDVNLEIRRGDRIWLQGGNGCGKTSLANVLTGIHANDSGDIFYNDSPYRGADMASLRNHICMIGTKPELFHASVEENILLGLDTEIPQFMRHILEEKGIALDRLVSEKGANLSGGEAKIVQFFQGIIKDADMYILDEPLNFIDDQYAQVILNLIDEYLQAKTLLIISHDARVAQCCSRILKIENKQIMEE